MAFDLLKKAFDLLILVFSASKMAYYFLKKAFDLLKMAFDLLILVFSASKMAFDLLILVFSASKMAYYLFKMAFYLLISVVRAFDDNYDYVSKTVADLPKFSQADQYGNTLR